MTGFHRVAGRVPFEDGTAVTGSTLLQLGQPIQFPSVTLRWGGEWWSDGGQLFCTPLLQLFFRDLKDQTVYRLPTVYRMSLSLTSSTRSEIAASRLRQEILDGGISSGHLLAESAVAQRLGVSRVPVREALFTLEREGLVEFSTTGRAYVKELAPHDFEELYVLRLALEPVAARLAAPALRKDASALEKNIKATSGASSLIKVTHLDLDFHEIILEACGNARLLKLWKSLRGELELWLGRLHRSKQIQTRGTREETVATHRDLLECFRTQSPAVCERKMREHILGWREWLPPMEVQA